MYYKTTAILVLVIYSISSVQSQGRPPLRDELRANLTRMVKFVVHPSAQASNEIVDYALNMGGKPKTISERIGYLGFIKDIARGIPEAMAQFTSTRTLPDGSTVQQIDENRFDNVITDKARAYSNRDKQQETGASASGTGSGSGTTTVTASGSGSMNSFSGNVNAAGVGAQPNMLAPPTTMPPLNAANDGTISLFDIYNAIRMNNQINNNLNL